MQPWSAYTKTQFRLLKKEYLKTQCLVTGEKVLVKSHEVIFLTSKTDIFDFVSEFYTKEYC